MTREEALIQFKENEAKDIFRVANAKFASHLEKNLPKIADVFMKAFETIADMCEKECPDTTIAEICFSYLQVHVIDETYVWLVSAHDSDRAYSKLDISVEIDLKEIFEDFAGVKEQLYKASMKYVNTLAFTDCDLFMVDNFVGLSGYFYAASVAVFRDIELNSRFALMKKSDLLRIIVGEYMGTSFPVYVYRNGDIRDFLEETVKKIDGDPYEDCWKENDYCMLPFVDFDFKNLYINMRNLSFGRFRKSRFTNVCAFATNFYGTDMRDIVFKNCEIHGCVFLCADFSNACFDNVSFQANRIDYLPEKDKIDINLGVLSVSFRNASFKHVDFSGCYLGGCDFSGAEFIGENKFEFADLTGARIDKKYKDVLDLDKSQKQSVLWIG